MMTMMKLASMNMRSILSSASLSFSITVTGTTGALAIAVLLLAFALVVRRRRELRLKPKKNYPPAPSTLPVIGHLHHLSKYAENPWEGFDALRAAHGDIVGLQLGVHPAVMVSSGELMREVLLQKGDIFCNRPSFDRYRQIFGGDRDNSLALCDWTDLQRKRRLVATIGILPRFGSNLYHHLNACIQIDVAAYDAVLKRERVLRKSDLLFACANMFTNYLCSKRFEPSDAAYVDILYIYDYVFYDINQCYAIDFIPALGKLGVGRTYVNDLVAKCNKLRKYMEDTLLTPRVAKYTNGANNNDGLNGQASTDSTNTTTGTCTTEDSERSAAENGGEQQHNAIDDQDDFLSHDKDFLDVSLEHHFEDPKSYPWDVNVYEVLDLIGGHSAVGNLLMRLLGLLSLDREAQDRIYQEARAAIDATGHTQVNLDHKTMMPYTEAAIWETLRLASSPIVPHVAAKATTLQGYDIDEGTMIMFNSYHLNMCDQFWKEPRKFDPRRFLQTSAGGTVVLTKPDNFFPFSCGRRACLGYKMVTAITFSMVANICSRWVMSAVDGDIVEQQLTPKGSLALCPDHTFQLHLTERE